MCNINATHGNIAITENQPLNNVAGHEPTHYSKPRSALSNEPTNS